MFYAGFGCLSAIGADAEMTFSAIDAGISGYRESDFTCADKSLAITAHINDDIFSQFALDTDYTGPYTAKMDRCSKAILYALNDILPKLPDGASLPLIWLEEEPHPSRQPIPQEFLKDQLDYFDVPIDLSRIHRVAMGRAGGIAALTLADKMMHQAGQDYVLIGGAECPFHTPWLEYLDGKNRLKREGSKDGFAPGEATAFLLLSRTQEAVTQQALPVIQVHLPGLAESPAHWYNETANTGETLHQTFVTALENAGLMLEAGSRKVDLIHSSMNGESFWGKEYGVAITRLSDRFTDNHQLLHPFEFTGDLGCVSGIFLIAAAADRMIKQQSRTALAYASSDNAWRAATCLQLR